MSFDDDLPQLADLIAERYGVADQRLTDLIDAGNRLANILAARKRRPKKAARALADWDAARDRFTP